MHEKLEARNGMIKTTPKDKYDVNNAVKTQLYEINSKPIIKSLGETTFENTLGKTKHRVHEKPVIRAATGDINMSEEAEMRMLKTNPKGENNAVTPIEDPNTVQW
jgi:hypothetical protein